MTAWLMLAAGELRQHGGNDGYDDAPSKRYHWNSTVPNCTKPAGKDLIALWDKEQLLGVSVIEEINVKENVPFTRRRCPNCNKTTLKARETATPLWRCYRCKHEFDTPVFEDLLVTDYMTRHEAAWTDLQGTLDAATLRSLCTEPDSQHSIRELVWERLTEKLEEIGGLGSINVVEKIKEQIEGGFTTITVRARVGQANFRAALVARYGNRCAITGSQPREALDAAHLCSYATHGTHDVQGGLMLRKDIHRLFDAGLICINPETLCIDLHPDLDGFETYTVKHGAKVDITMDVSTIEWLRLHWSMHRKAPAAAGTP